MRSIKDAGADGIRGGAYKPRSSPHSFQGLGLEALPLLKEASEETGLPVTAEILDPNDLDPLLEIADTLQIGARNMQNFSLLRQVGQTDKRILLKRGFSSTLDEMCFALEYITNEGNENVVLCERGIRTFEPSYRFTLDITAVPVLKERTGLPVFVDPSHAPGRRDLVPRLMLASAAIGANGLIVEVHPNPSEAKSDPDQQLTLSQFEDAIVTTREVDLLVNIL